MFNNIITILKNNHQTISTMESCTGGAVANAITNIEGASDVFEFGTITYSNAYKIKMGVDPHIIEKYTVYSLETAREMSRAITTYTNSDYGIGITGQLNRPDPNNPSDNHNLVHISIYNKSKNTYTDKILEVTKSTREENKNQVIQAIISSLETILSNQ